ncbi:MAG: helix-turn-helix domain-containing protein [Hyphomicrobiales bacterium]|jgi:DNA-binding transcriptional regulator YdaS (Cro superfamily)
MPQEISRQEADTRLAIALERAGSAAALAARLGLSPSYVSDVRRGVRPASPRLLAAIGVRKQTRYIVEA